MFGHDEPSQNVSRLLIFFGLSLLAIAVFHGARGTLVRMVWARIFSPPDAQFAATYKANATTRNGSNTPSAQAKEATGHAGTPADAALQNFQSRCAQAGVIVCQGFDTASVFAQPTWPATGLYYGMDCPSLPARCVQQDANVSFSGASSARWDIYGNTGENAEGNWVQNFPQTFGPSTTFYVQYAFRADPNWVSIDWTKTGPEGSNTAPKLSIFHNHAATCAAEEITIHNHNSWTTPTAYSDCGNEQFTTKLDGVTCTSYPPFLLQQGFTAPAPFTGEKCQWADEGPVGTCFRIQANTWYTLYFKIHVGNWGEANSSLEAWFAPQGHGMKKFISVLLYKLNQDKDAAGFDALTLTQYMTGKQTRAKHPTAHVWYDELIVSAQPIPAPTGPTP
jgi:hypothetical protein